MGFKCSTAPLWTGSCGTLLVCLRGLRLARRWHGCCSILKIGNYSAAKIEGSLGRVKVSARARDMRIAMNGVDEGFTLLELLVVIAIIAVLALIAMSQFQVYKASAYNATARSDLKRSLIAQEAAYLDQGSYLACADVASCEAVLPMFKASRENGGAAIYAIFRHDPGADNTFSAEARHVRGDLTYHFESNGGMTEQ
jgi:prepilin-type N-terminal cleavage/methylation domain-containing protein